MAKFWHDNPECKRWGLLFTTTFYYLLQAAAADALSKFYYPPVAAVSISYPKEAIRSECLMDGELKGFGQLHPRSQGVETLGEYWFNKEKLEAFNTVSSTCF